MAGASLYGSIVRGTSLMRRSPYAPGPALTGSVYAIETLFSSVISAAPSTMVGCMRSTTVIPNSGDEGNALPATSLMPPMLAL